MLTFKDSILRFVLFVDSYFISFWKMFLVLHRNVTQNWFWGVDCLLSTVFWHIILYVWVVLESFGRSDSVACGLSNTFNIDRVKFVFGGVWAGLDTLSVSDVILFFCPFHLDIKAATI